MIPLLYANNADIKYPLSDFHETGIPNDILLDLSLSVPAIKDPILGALRIGPTTVFLSIEDRETRVSIASVLVTYPVAARVYPLENVGAGVWLGSIWLPSNYRRAVLQRGCNC